jgi:hypothetical protein
MGGDPGGWNDASQKPADGRRVLALMAVPNMGYSDAACAWVIARWDAGKNYWRIVDVPNDRGYQSPVNPMIKVWRELPLAPDGTEIVEG